MLDRTNALMKRGVTPAVAALAIAFAVFLVFASPRYRDRYFAAAWTCAVLAGLAWSRGRGWRAVIVPTLAAAAVGLVYGAYFLNPGPDVAARRKIGEAAFPAAILLSRALLFVAACAAAGMMVGAAVRWVVEGRKVRFGAAVMLLLAWAVLAAVLKGAPALEGARKGRALMPPLGAKDYVQYPAVVELEGKTIPPPRRLSETWEPERDIAYGPHGRSNMLDLYRPRTAGAPAPVVVYIPGGGWVEGDKADVPAAWLEPLLRSGIAVASINHRLAGPDRRGLGPSRGPRALFPAQVQDGKAAVRFLRANAEKYGLDPDHIGAMGHSSGGHLAALLGVAADVPEFEADGWNRGVSSRVQAVVASGGIYDLRVLAEQIPLHMKCLNDPRADYSDPGDSIVRSLLGCPLEGNLERVARASPVHYVSADDPPALIVHGFRDSSVPPHQAEYFHSVLRRAGVDSRLVLIPGAGHVCVGIDDDDRIPERLVEFFGAHLRTGRGPG